MIDKIFYTYLWLREDGTPYYIGKGTGRRAFVQDGHRVKLPVSERILIQEYESEKDAFFAEQFLITLYGRLDLGTGCLANLTNGGDAPPKCFGRKWSDEFKSMMRDRFKGIPLSEEHKQKLSDAHKGFKPSVETRRKLSLARMGNKYSVGREISEEHRRSISRAHKGKIVSEETRKKLSAANRAFRDRLKDEKALVVAA